MRKTERAMLASVVFWMDDLLCTARELQQDLMRFYVGWPPHIEALVAPTDYDTVLEEAKRFMAQPFEWASIINSLANMVLDGATSNDRDYAQDMIEMVIPYLER